MTRKADVILLIVACLFLASVASRNGTLALMAIPFLAFLGMGLFASPDSPRLNVARTLDSERRRENQPTTLTIHIVNDGDEIPCLVLVDHPQRNQTIMENYSTRKIRLSPGEQVDFKHTFQAPMGRYDWNELTAFASDPFHLFEQKIPLQSTARLLVVPDPKRLRQLRFHPQSTIHTPGTNLSRFPGSGVDFWGVREYHIGDSLRSIHWRLAARHTGQFYSKEYEREEMADIGLILDSRIPNPRPEVNEDFFHYSIQATAELAKTFLDSGNRVSLLALGDRVSRAFPGYGKRQLVNILDQLAGCQPSGHGSLDTLRYLPVRLFPSRAMIVLISPLQPQDFKTIARLRSEGYQILVVSPDPVQYAMNERKLRPPSLTAFRIATLERKTLIWRITQLGVEVINWSVDQPLERAIQSPGRARR